MTGLKILVVEDYYAVRQLLRDALQEIGHTVTEVARFEEGEREISRNIYDLVITDVRLPGGTGEDLAAKASALGGQVILITGYEDVRQLLERAKIRHLFKPFRMSELFTLIEECFAPPATRSRKDPV